jgi:ribosomal-protein-alanine N-acetyltransferase
MQALITTKRLILRQIILEDDKGIFELDSDPAVHRYLGNAPITTIEEARTVIQFIQQQYINNGIGRWAIIEKKTNLFIGWAGLKLVKEITNAHVDYYDIGYRLIKKYWGQGFATEAAEAWLNYGFTTMGLSTIYAMADVNNAASKKVLEKIGLNYIENFTFDETEHSWLSITKKEWANKNQVIKL